ncbi:MAG: IPTL-CTERM sorting domain-containing protein [Burkholderiales bacterium]|nr:IPTL-CTERM sorting domain-containing protein [Burkholderiales bacterium]
MRTLILLAAWLAVPAWAATVTNLGDSGAGSLRDAIAATPAGGTIDFQGGLAGTITLASTLTLSKNVTITGPGASEVSISGNNARRVLQVNSGVTATVTGLTITGGRTTNTDDNGAGVNNNGGTLTLQDVVVTANSVANGNGAGIYNGSSATLTLRRVTVSSNRVESISKYGGGLGTSYAAKAIVMEDSLFDANVGGGGGGAIDSSAPGAVIRNSVFTGNSAVSGGAIRASNYFMVISGSTFSDNKATASFTTGVNGGAIRVTSFTSGTTTLANSTLSGNSAGASGGGIYAESSITVNNSTLSGNTSAASGGGIYRGSGTTTLNSVTITANKCTNANCSGGGISGNATAANTIVRGNTSTGNNPDMSGTLTNRGGNGLLNTTATAPSTPLLLSALGNYGGSTQTMLPLPGSPAICAGTATPTSLALLATDQRGATRGFNGYTPSPCVDAGAVQTHYALTFTQQPGDALVNTAMSPAPQMQLTENGAPFTQAPATLTMALPAGQGSVSGATATTSASDGTASWPALAIDTRGTARQLTASLVLNTSPAASVSTLSDPFNVRATAPVTLSGLQHTYTGAGQGATVVTDPADLPVTVTYDGSATLPVNAGSYAVEAVIVSDEYTGSASGTLVIARAAQVLTFPAQEPLSHTFSDGATFDINPAATSSHPARAIRYSSLSGTICTVTDTVVTMVAPGDCVIAADQDGDTNHTAAAQMKQTVTLKALTTFSGTTVPTDPAKAGEATASFTGGGQACRYDLSHTAFIAAPAAPPAGKTLPQGMFKFKLIGCEPGSTVAMRIVWPQPVTGYTKYGRESANARTSSYFEPNDLKIIGSEVLFTVPDGDKGDDDWTRNGEIVDPSGPLEPAATAAVAPIPTLGQWSLMLLGLLAAGLGARRLRRV